MSTIDKRTEQLLSLCQQNIIQMTLKTLIISSFVLVMRFTFVKTLQTLRVETKSANVNGNVNIINFNSALSPLLHLLKVPKVRISFFLSFFFSFRNSNKSKQQQEVCQFLQLSRTIFTYQKLFIVSSGARQVLYLTDCQRQRRTVCSVLVCYSCVFLEILQQVLLWC